ncbi:MAG: hypothetical protein J0M04_20935 [Verrucomicrobia bacterium]|nr:hypothetical protein [Verrucomicrobiota bacterium]
MIPPIRTTAAVAACWLACVSTPYAETGTPEHDPFAKQDSLPKMIRVQVEFIEVSHPQYTELMATPRKTTNDTDLRARLTALTKEGKATVVETLAATGKSGQKATSESIEEIIYATEYEPPELPCNGVSGQKSEPNPNTVNGPTPSAWDTRNTGGTLEIEPNITDDGHFIDIRLVPEIVYHVGNRVWMEWKDDHGKANIEMPDFYTVRMNTSLTVVDGQPFLAAALSPKNDKGACDPTRKLMVFVRADIVTVGK